MDLTQMPGRNRVPIFRKRIRGRFPLHLGHSVFHFVNQLFSQSIELRGIDPILAKQKFSGDLQTVPAERRIFKLWIDVTLPGLRDVALRIMFSVTAQPEQRGHHQLRPTTGARTGEGS